MEAISRFLAEERDYNISRDILGSETAVIERLQADSLEMQDAWQSLSKQCGDERQLFSVLRKIINLAAFYKPEAAKKARELACYERELRSDIDEAANHLLKLLRRYKNALSQSSIASEVVSPHVVDLMDAWADGTLTLDAHLYRQNLREHLWDMRDGSSSVYWPTIEDCLVGLSEKCKLPVHSVDNSLDVLTDSRESSKADFVRVMAASLSECRIELSNRDFASLMNCSLGLIDDAVNLEWVKKTRQRVRKGGDN